MFRSEIGDQLTSMDESRGGRRQEMGEEVRTRPRDLTRVERLTINPLPELPSYRVDRRAAQVAGINQGTSQDVEKCGLGHGFVGHTSCLCAFSENRSV